MTHGARKILPLDRPQTAVSVASSSSSSEYASISFVGSAETVEPRVPGTRRGLQNRGLHGGEVLLRSFTTSQLSTVRRANPAAPDRRGPVVRVDDESCPYRAGKPAGQLPKTAWRCQEKGAPEPLGETLQAPASPRPCKMRAPDLARTSSPQIDQYAPPFLHPSPSRGLGSPERSA